jgi:hypothetical protein
VEYISFGTAYTVKSIAANVATATGNVVTEAGKYLYYAAGHGLLSNYNPLSASDNAQLQDAIWSLVIKGDSPNYNPSDVNPSNYAYGNVYTYLSSPNVVAPAAGTAGDYRNFAVGAIANAEALAFADRIFVLNPAQTLTGPEAQSMVFEVPEPASIAVWSVLAGGAAGLSVVKRRRHKIANGRWDDEARHAIFAVVDNGKARH